MDVRVFTPAEDVLAGRVVEAVRSSAPNARVTLTVDPDEFADRSDDDRVVSVVIADGDTPSDLFADADPVVALVTADGSVPDDVPRVPVDPDEPEEALAAVRAWLRAVASEGDEDAADGGFGRAAGAAAVGGLVGLVVGGLLGDDGDPPLGGDLY